MNVSRQKAILIWDGECRLCRKCIEWIEKRDGTGVFFFVSYQEVPSPPMTSTMTRQCQQAVQLIPPGGQMLSGGGAVLGVLSLLGWKKFSVIFSLLPLSLMVEALYRVIARNRRVFARILFGK